MLPVACISRAFTIVSFVQCLILQIRLHVLIFQVFYFCVAPTDTSTRSKEEDDTNDIGELDMDNLAEIHCFV